MGTTEQTTKIEKLRKDGYIWDEQLSISYCAVVMVKGEDRYIFGLDGTISHNPSYITVKV